MSKKIIWIVLGLLLAAFAVYILLDTFVIERAHTSVPSEDTEQGVDADPDSTPPEDGADAVETPTAVITENSYEDDNISITITEHREYETNIYVADVQLSSPEYLKTALAEGTFGQNIKEETSDIAKDVNAILAVNGDFYGVRESGYVVRNGVLYRDTLSEKDRDILVIYQDGAFAIMEEQSTSADQLVADGAEQVLCFGPSLVSGGQFAVTSHSKSKQPRTAIGLIDELHYVFVVTDGRIDESEGLSFQELAEFMLSLGVKEGYNLDGGGSSSMYFNGESVNRFIQDDERRVSDIVYIGY